MANRLKRFGKRCSRVLLLFGVGLLAQVIGCLPTDSVLLQKSCGVCCDLAVMGLFFCWLLSMRARMTQRNIYRYIRASALLILALLLTRVTRGAFWLGTGTLPRMLWYFSYLAILFLPLLNFFAALCVGREEDYRVPKKLKLLYLAATLLFLCVMTNDTHRLVFRFGSVPFSENDFVCGPLFYVLAAWVAAFMLLFLGVLCNRCRLSNSLRRAAPPLVVVFLGAAYLALRAVLPAGSLLYTPLHLMDGILMLCLCDAALWEACMATGLVLSNSRFDVLFAHSTLRAQILDRTGQVRCASEGAQPFSPDLVAAARRGPLMLDENTRLNCSPIGGGCVLWTEDLTDVNRVIRKIEKTVGRLEESNRALSKENEIKRRLTEVREQNRLYAGIAAAVSNDLQRLRTLLEEIDSGAPPRSGFARVCVCSAFLKRKINLLLLAESNRTLPSRELDYAVRESLHYAALCGVQSTLVSFPDTLLASEALVAAYDRFEALLEARLTAPCSVTVQLRRSGPDVAAVFLPPQTGKAGED